MATDPFRYFRIEARELVDGLAQGIVELEKGAPVPLEVAKLLRFAHTLKGAARVVKKSDIANAAHGIEDLLSPLRESTQPLRTKQLDELVVLVDSIETALGSLGAENSNTAKTQEERQAARKVQNALELEAEQRPLPANKQQASTVQESLETVRVDLTELDQLLTVLTSTGTELAGLKRQVTELQSVAYVAYSLTSHLKKGQDRRVELSEEVDLSSELHRQLEQTSQDLLDGAERLERELSEAHERADRLRLIPVRTLEVPLSRAVRDTARTLNKDIVFELDGGDVRLDSRVLLPLKNALGHVVRNAAAHGIETPEKRRSLGKPPRGTVRLVVVNRGKNVVCTCSDDGSGIDEEAVVRRMVEQGALRPFDRPSREELFDKMLSGGVSTSKEVTQISGRGIGLDAIRETAQQLDGKVRLESERNRGTKVSFDVPLSLASLPALLVEAGGTTAAIPLEAIVETRRFSHDEISATAEGTSVDVDGTILPFLPLGRALHVEDTWAQRKAIPSVVLRSKTRRAAFGVDALKGISDVVTRPLPRGLAAEPTVVGISMDANGHPRLVLDPSVLIEAANSGWQRARETTTSRAPILVIDDSLTTRMLEKSILESAGHQVELATSGEEGMAKARTKEFSIFLVDVDMPGMSGFEFVAQTRADPKLRRTPAILVTSRDSQEDLEKGRKVGAGDYVIKGEFDQNRLLKSIERLLSS